MAELKVLHIPDPRLRHKALPVERFDLALRKLAKDMLETMYAEDGIGLAAIQVGVPHRVLVYDLTPDRSRPQTLVNPEILHREGSTSSREGCLSVPGCFDYVERAARIRYRALDLEGRAREEDCEGLQAICLQHECDHLDGKLFIDYLSPIKRRRLLKKLEKLKRRETAPVL